MIDQKAAANIRDHGSFLESAEKKNKLLQELGFPVGQEADYAFIAGCGYTELIPHVFKALKELMDYFGISYTLMYTLMPRERSQRSWPKTMKKLPKTRSFTKSL